MTPSVRVEIDGGRGGFRSGVLYNELEPMLKALYNDGKAAVAFAVGSSIIVGHCDPSLGICWADHAPPLQACRDTTGRKAYGASR